MTRKKRREIVNAEGAVEGNMFLGEEPPDHEEGLGRRTTPPRTGWASHIEEIGAVADTVIGFPHPDEPPLPP